MEVLLKEKEELLGIAFMIVLLFLSISVYTSTNSNRIDSFYYESSVIEEGTIIERNDSVRTVVIPDRR